MKRVTNFIRQQFHRLGFYVGSHPGFTIAFTVTLFVFLQGSLRAIRFNLKGQLEFVAPRGTQSRTDMRVHNAFNDLHFDCIPDFLNPNRTLNPGRLMPDRVASWYNVLALIIVPKDGESALRPDVLAEATLVQGGVLGITVEKFGKVWTFRDLCLRKYSTCAGNSISACDENKIDMCMFTNVTQLAEAVEEIGKDDLEFSWPFMMLGRELDEPMYGPAILGGTSIMDETLKDAKALRLTFILNNRDPITSEVLWDWSKGVHTKMEELKAKTLRQTHVSYLTQDFWSQEEIELLMELIKTLLISGLALVIFTTYSSMTQDWVTSKFWLGTLVVIAIGMSILTSVALLTICGVPFTVYTPVIGMIAIGIGVDDGFVLMNAWAVTPTDKTIPERMAIAYAEAGASMATTSLTNLVGFLVLTTLPIYYMNVFGMNAAITVAFAYVYTMTFFGGCLALMAKAEDQNRHCVTFRKLPVKEDGKYLIPVLSKILEVDYCKYWASALGHKTAKYIIGTMYVIYLATGIYCCSQTEFFLELNSNVLETSPVKSFLKSTEKYFLDYSERYSIILDAPIDYSDPVVQKDLLKLAEEFETGGKFRDAMYSDFWLRSFLEYVERNQNHLSLNITGEKNFTMNLRKYFLVGKDNPFAGDIRFDKTGRIIKSRFQLQPSALDSVMGFKQLMDYTQKSVEKKHLKAYKITAYNPNNVASAEMFAFICSQLIPTASATCCIIALITLMVLPEKLYSIFVTFCIVSTEVGIIAGLFFMGYKLDYNAFNSLIMAFAFSVDSVAHMCFAFAEENENKDVSPVIRLEMALKRVLRALFTGCVSTIVALAPAYFVNSEITKALALGVVITMILSFTHGAIFLPTLLVAVPEASLNSIFGKNKQKTKAKDEMTADEKNEVEWTGLMDTLENYDLKETVI